MTTVLSFSEDPPRMPGLDDPVHPADALLLNLEGYEGPIDLLLQLARDQKVDLTRISILQLARQYLVFIDRAKELRLDLAAEYLVMAAWLAYLKSRLLLPRAEGPQEEPSAQEMAEALAYQLRRLEAMQQAGAALVARSQLGVNFFARGEILSASAQVQTVFTADLFDLLKAYGEMTRRNTPVYYELPRFRLMSMEDALDRLSRMLGGLPRQGRDTVWATLQTFLPPAEEVGADPLYVRSAMASVLTASLEMAKQGQVELRQDGPFRPVYLRGRSDPPLSEDVSHE